MMKREHLEGNSKAVRCEFLGNNARKTSAIDVGWKFTIAYYKHCKEIFLHCFCSKRRKLKGKVSFLYQNNALSLPDLVNEMVRKTYINIKCHK